MARHTVPKVHRRVVSINQCLYVYMYVCIDESGPVNDPTATHTGF